MRQQTRKTKNDLFACLGALKKENAAAFSLPFFSVDTLAASVKKKAPQLEKVTTRPNLIFWLRQNGYLYRELHHKGAHLRLWSDIESYKRFRYLVRFHEQNPDFIKPRPAENVFESFFFPNGLPTAKNSKKT